MTVPAHTRPDPACPRPALPPALLWLMSFATGLAVASNYYAQPLLHTIAVQFGLSTGAAGAIVTTAQLSYAVGLLLLVPLGDLLERRTLVVGMTVLTAGGLLVTAFAPGFAWVLAGTALTGLLSVVVQVLVPHAATLAAPAERGRVVGTMMMGLLLGVLLARTAAGLLAEAGSWRTVYWAAAAMLLATAAALWRCLPRWRNPVKLGYPALLASILVLFRQEPMFRARSVLGALVFSVFSVLWTSLTFLLAAPPFGYSDATIGLFGLAGAAGALAARAAGKLADRGGANRTTLAGLGLMLLAWAPLAYARVSVAALLAGILVLDLALQAVHVTNQSSIYRLRPEARSRLTSGYMTALFAGGAAGSLSSAWTYAHAGWTGVCLLGAGLTAAALLYAACAPGARVPAHAADTA